MWKIILSFLTFITILRIAAGLQCYNCFTIDIQGTRIQPKGEELTECTDNKTDWNTWQCPEEKPYCSSMLYEEIGPNEAFESAYTILRTCSDKNTCSDPIPGLNVILCLLCQDDLCNGEDIQPKYYSNSKKRS